MEAQVLYLKSCGYHSEDIADRLGVPLDYVIYVLRLDD